jgi:hypothetical protein
MNFPSYGRCFRVLLLFFPVTPCLSAQCPANPPQYLCSATLVTGSATSPITQVVGITGNNPVAPPADVNSIITDTSFSTAGVRILRVTAPGFDNRSSTATNDSYEVSGDLHYMNSSVDDSTFIIGDDHGVSYVMSLNTATFQSSMIPCSFSATSGNLAQIGNCHAITSNGTGQKYLILNAGSSPVSNIYVGSHPYSHTRANALYTFENSDSNGVSVYEINIAPTLANQMNPPTLLNGGNPIVNPWNAPCFPAGTSKSLTAESLKLDLNDTNIAGNMGTSSLSTNYVFVYNTSTISCFTLGGSGLVYYTNGASPTPLVFYGQDGTTAWGASPTVQGAIHSIDISLDGHWIFWTQPSSWDNDGKHCNASCNFIWKIGTSTVVTALRTDGHGNIGYATFDKFRVPSGNQAQIENFPYASPSGASEVVLAAAQFGSDLTHWPDMHSDSNTFTNAASQYTCVVSFSSGSFNNSAPGGAETLSNPLENEIFCYDQAGNVWRVAHDHTAGLSGQDFAGAEGYPSTSRSGKYVFFGSEWGGLLGDLNGNTCTAWANCRTDVFVVELDGSSAAVPTPPAPPAPPTNLRGTVR